MLSIDQHLFSEKETLSYGSRFAHALRTLPTCTLILFLDGPLGTGKTTFTRGTLRALGVSGPIKSPSFSLVEVYEVDRWHILHIDLYRLTHPRAWETIGLETPEDGKTTMWIIEWASRAQDTLPPADLVISFSLSCDFTLTLHLQATSPHGHHVLAHLP